MRLFLDTANIDEIKAASQLGVIAGVTTNPSLIAREGRNFQEVVREICAVVDGPISAEVVSMEAEGMVAEAMPLTEIHKNIVIKIPTTLEGLKAVKVLSARGVKTNVTLGFSANQAFLAALAGATYVSLFVGRVDDINEDGIRAVEQTAEILRKSGLAAKIIAASIRNPLHVTRSALAGADIATVPYKVLLQMVKHPLTDSGITAFLKDWAKVPG